MILNDRLIREYCIQQNMIEPFDEQRVNPASYDLTLYGKIIEITPGGIMDASNTGNAAHRLTSQRTLQLNYGQSYLLQPGVFILASSVEYIRLPAELAGEVKLKSTTARKGIGHVYSGWIDPGFEGQITFELFSHVPVLLEPGRPIAQMIFAQMAEIPEQPYKGRYQHQQGPTPARQMEFPGLDLLVKSGYEDAKGNPMPPMSVDTAITAQDYSVASVMYFASDVVSKEAVVIPPGIDQIWGDSAGNVYVKTPDGKEYTLTLEQVRNNPKPIRQQLQEFVDSIVNPDDRVQTLMKAVRDDFGPQPKLHIADNRNPITYQPPPKVDRDWSED